MLVSGPGFSRPLAIALLALGLGLAGCDSRAPSRGAPADTASATPPMPAPDTLVEASGYRAVAIPTRKALRDLSAKLGAERFAIVLKVNRRDSLHVREGDTLAVPRDSTLQLMDLSPFPRELPAARDSAKLILVARRVQAFAAYEGGRLVRWGPTSSGRESLQTPAGLYHANWKSRRRTSTFNDEWLLEWYVNFENYLGISFHLYDLPGYPASHSCVRLLEDDARWLYGWVDTWQLDPDGRRVLRPGTPIVVFGRYAFGARPPWRSLPQDSTATTVSLSEIVAALEDHRSPFQADRSAVVRAIESRRRAPRDTIPRPDSGR